MISKEAYFKISNIVQKIIEEALPENHLDWCEQIHDVIDKEVKKERDRILDREKIKEMLFDYMRLFEEDYSYKLADKIIEELK